MTCIATQKIRRKAVWGSRLTLGALSLALVFFSSLNAFAAGPHAHRASATRAGRPNSLAKGYRIDGELTKRSRGNGSAKTRVIVELQPGAAACGLSPVHAA